MRHNPLTLNVVSMVVLLSLYTSGFTDNHWVAAVIMIRAALAAFSGVVSLLYCESMAFNITEQGLVSRDHVKPAYRWLCASHDILFIVVMALLSWWWCAEAFIITLVGEQLLFARCAQILAKRS